MRVAFLVRSLGHGGAERQMAVLAQGLLARGHEVAVVAFYGGGPVEEDLRAAGVPLHSLAKGGRWDVAGFLFRAVRLLRWLRPDVLHGYLAVPGIVAVALKPLLPGARVVMGVRAADMDLALYDWLARWTYWLERWLSRFADLVIVNSAAGRRHAVACGYPSERTVMIPNGIDTDRFRPDPEGRRRLRAAWGVAEGERLVGLVARLDPIKDHATFLEAAAAASRRLGDLRFACVGDGPTAYRDSLHAMAERLGLGARVIWAGERADLPAVYSAFDLAALSSTSEGFPNVLAEAMACGVPCVATDVGDAVGIVGDTGAVVPPRSPTTLAEAFCRMLSLDREERARLAEQARARVVAEFSAEALVARSERALAALVGQ